jgi:hypothetical protein
MLGWWYRPVNFGAKRELASYRVEAEEGDFGEDAHHPQVVASPKFQPRRLTFAVSCFDICGLAF